MLHRILVTSYLNLTVVCESSLYRTRIRHLSVSLNLCGYQIKSAPIAGRATIDLISLLEDIIADDVVTVFAAVAATTSNPSKGCTLLIRFDSVMIVLSFLLQKMISTKSPSTYYLQVR